jgi:DNA-binding NarL/FixJ family response regulator
MIRVLLADDHPLILRGVRELFASEADIEIVGAETDPGEVPATVERLKPDVLIQDLSMAGQLSGLLVIRRVRERFPATKIVVLSMHSSLASIHEAMEHGAAGYVSKHADLLQLIAAVRNVHKGDRHFGSPFTLEQVEDYARTTRRDRSRALGALTKREIEVLSMVVRGRTSGEIAEVLHIGRRTVESHRANLSSKLGVRNQAELVRYVFERGLVAPH